MTFLTDSSFLYALYNEADSNSNIARKFADETKEVLLVAEVTLVEIAYLIERDLGHYAIEQFLGKFGQMPVRFVSLTMDDLRRVRAIMVTYKSAELDLVDCCIMALAERLNITRICTFDRRDFSIFRPRHCEYLELLP